MKARGSIRNVARAMAVLVLLASTGCTMRGSGKMAAPAFKRMGREHVLPVTPRTHHAGVLDVAIVSGSISETYTVVGSEDWTSYIKVILTNTGAKELTIKMEDFSAWRETVQTAVYFNTVAIAPGASAEVKIAVPSGLNKLDKPVALVYDKVRINLN